MRLVKQNVEFNINGKKKVKADIYQDNLRKGYKAPKALFLKYKNRWITSYEMRVRHWSGIPLNVLFQIVYGEHISDLVYDRNPLLSIRLDKDLRIGAIIR